MTAKLLWPKDAVILVCATPEAALRDQMESVHAGACRHCGREIVYDGHTMRLAEQTPLRRGRPVEFFCVECFNLYEFGDVTHYVDDRRHKAVLQEQ